MPKITLYTLDENGLTPTTSTSIDASAITADKEVILHNGEWSLATLHIDDTSYLIGKIAFNSHNNEAFEVCIWTREAFGRHRGGVTLNGDATKEVWFGTAYGRIFVSDYKIAIRGWWKHDTE